MKITESSETCDAILGGMLRVIQRRKGYRFSVDSILLARFVQVRRGDRVLGSVFHGARIPEQLAAAGYVSCFPACC